MCIRQDIDSSAKCLYVLIFIAFKQLHTFFHFFFIEKHVMCFTFQCMVDAKKDLCVSYYTSMYVSDVYAYILLHVNLLIYIVKI